MLDTIVAPVLLNNERVIYAGSLARFVGRTFTVVGAMQHATRGWVYFIEDETSGLRLDFAGRDSLIPLAW